MVRFAWALRADAIRVLCKISLLTSFLVIFVEFTAYGTYQCLCNVPLGSFITEVMKCASWTQHYSAVTCQMISRRLESLSRILISRVDKRACALLSGQCRRIDQLQAHTKVINHVHVSTLQKVRLQSWTIYVIYQNWVLGWKHSASKCEVWWVMVTANQMGNQFDSVQLSSCIVFLLLDRLFEGIWLCKGVTGVWLQELLWGSSLLLVEVLSLAIITINEFQVWHDLYFICSGVEMWFRQ